MKRGRRTFHRVVTAVALLGVVAATNSCSSTDDSQDTAAPSIELTGGPNLSIRVQPSLPGPGAWALTLQQKAGDAWADVSDARTVGDLEVASLTVPAGEYRVVAAAQHGHPAAESDAIEYTPQPAVALRSAGGSLLTTLRPVAADGDDWSVTLEREADDGWATVRTVQTDAARPVLWNVIDDGTYRVRTAARDRFPAYTGSTLDYRFSPPAGPVPLSLVDAIFAGPKVAETSASAEPPTADAAPATLMASSTPSGCGSVMSGVGTDTMIASGFVGFVPVAGPLLAGGSNAAGLIFSGSGGNAAAGCLQAQFASINAQLALQEAQIEKLQLQLAQAKSQIIQTVYAEDQNQLETDRTGYSSALFWFANQNGTNCGNFGRLMSTAGFWTSCTDTVPTDATVESSAQSSATYANVQQVVGGMGSDFDTNLENVAGVDLGPDATCADAGLVPPANPDDDPDCYEAVQLAGNNYLDTIFQEMASQLAVAMAADADAGANLVPLFDQYNSGLVSYYAQSVLALQQAFTMEYLINQLNYWNAGLSSDPIESLGSVNGTYYSFDALQAVLGGDEPTAQEQALYYNRAQKALTQLYVARVNMLYRLTLNYIVSDAPVGGQEWPSNAASSDNEINSHVDYQDNVGTSVSSAPNESTFVLAATPIGMLPAPATTGGSWTTNAALYQYDGLRDAGACYANLVTWNEANGTAVEAANGDSYPTVVPTVADEKDGSYDFDTQCPSILQTSDGAAVTAPQPTATTPTLTGCASYAAATNTAGGSCYDGNSLFPYSANDSTVGLGSAVLTNLLLCNSSEPALTWFQVGAANAGNAAGLTEGDWALTCGNWAAIGSDGWAKFPQSTPPTAWLADDNDYAKIGNLAWTGVVPNGSNSLADSLYNQLQFMTNCQYDYIDFSYPDGGIPAIRAPGYVIPTGPAAPYGADDCGGFSFNGTAFYSNRSGNAPLNIGGTANPSATVTLSPWAGDSTCASISSAIVADTSTPPTLDQSGCKLTFTKVTCSYGTDNRWQLQSQLDLLNMPVKNAANSDGSGGFQLPVTLGVVASTTTPASGSGGNCNSGSITLFQVWMSSGTPLAVNGYTAAVPTVSATDGSVTQTGYITVADGSCWQIETGRTADNVGTMTLAQLPDGSDCAT